MRTKPFATASLAIASFIALSGAQAGVLVPVTPFPGSTSSSILGINNGGVVAGSYSTTADNSDEHGFFGTPDGNYTSFDYGTGGTEPRAINTTGAITGIFQSVGCSQAVAPGATACEEFVRDKHGNFTTITNAGTPLVGIVEAMTPNGQFVGNYFRGLATNPIIAGFYGSNGVYTADITLPFTTRQTKSRGISSNGKVAGWFVALDGSTHAFVINSGAVTVFDFPDPSVTATFAEGINDKGEISGSWADGDGFLHGFFVTADLSTFTSIDAPGAPNTQAWQLNSQSEVAVGSDVGPFIYCAGNSNAHDYCKAKKGKGANAITIDKTLRVSSDSLRRYACTAGCVGGGEPTAVFTSPHASPAPAATAPQRQPRIAP